MHSGPTIPAGHVLSAAADFNQDRFADYVLYNPTTRQTTIWFLGIDDYYNFGVSLKTFFMGSASAPTIPGGYSLVGTADFNRDGTPDYVLFNATTQQASIWYLSRTLNGAAFFLTSGRRINIPAGYRVEGAADLNGDKKPDLVLFEAATRRTVFWYMNNASRIGVAVGPTLPVGYNLVAP